jgi:hypothetical protein
MSLSRRAFLLVAVAWPAGRSLQPESLAAAPLPQGSVAVRAPAPGQRWRYRISDGLTDAALATAEESIATVGTDVVIDGRTDRDASRPSGADSWNRAVREYFGGRPPATETLSREIQRPWGMIALDPHWDVPQIYVQPVPAWPTELRPGWKGRTTTEYLVSAHSGALSWQQTLRAERWERITVPAGTFMALRYRNDIVFTHADWARIHCNRQVTAWIAPEVGRWIKRMSSGSYYVNDTIDSSAYSEDWRTWELLEWA